MLVAQENDDPDSDTLPAASSADGSVPASSSQPSTAASSSQSSKTIEERRLDTLRFGTETEIAGLIQTLKNEKVSYLDKDLVEIAKNTRNRNILTGIFSLFSDAEKKGLEDRAIKAIRERDEEANETVLAAVDYLGRVRAREAADPIEELINSGENRFLNSSFRALGRLAGRQADGV